MAAEHFHPMNGIVIGNGYDGHAKVLEPLIDFRGVVVGLAAEAIQAGRSEHSRSPSVNVQVAAHEAILE